MFATLSFVFGSNIFSVQSKLIEDVNEIPVSYLLFTRHDMSLAHFVQTCRTHHRGTFMVETHCYIETNWPDCSQKASAVIDTDRLCFAFRINSKSISISTHTSNRTCHQWTILHSDHSIHGGVDGDTGGAGAVDATLHQTAHSFIRAISFIAISFRSKLMSCPLKCSTTVGKFNWFLKSNQDDGKQLCSTSCSVNRLMLYKPQLSLTMVAFPKWHRMSSMFHSSGAVLFTWD